MKYLRNRSFVISLLVGITVLAVAMLIQYYAGTYATEHASNAVTDIVLSNTRVYDLDGIFIYGSIVFWIFAIILGFIQPKRFPYALKAIALFVLVRSLFITLTHIGPFPTRDIIASDNVLRDITFGGDLFFSGHTGLPFLLALMFWQHKYLRVIFLICSVIFAVVVLLSHLHYSIDVLSAFFITYTINELAEKFFAKDRQLFLRGLDS